MYIYEERELINHEPVYLRKRIKDRYWTHITKKEYESREQMADSGEIKGRSHEEGGIRMVNRTTGREYEVEGDEFINCKDAMHDSTKRTFSGTNKEIVSQVNLTADCNPADDYKSNSSKMEDGGKVRGLEKVLVSKKGGVSTEHHRVAFRDLISDLKKSGDEDAEVYLQKYYDVGIGSQYAGEERIGIVKDIDQEDYYSAYDKLFAKGGEIEPDDIQKNVISKIKDYYGNYFEDYRILKTDGEGFDIRVYLKKNFNFENILKIRKEAPIEAFSIDPRGLTAAKQKTGEYPIGVEDERPFVDIFFERFRFDKGGVLMENGGDVQKEKSDSKEKLRLKAKARIRILELSK